MKNVNLQLNEELNILEQYNLTPTELFFVRLLFLTIEDDENEYLYRYLNLPSKGNIRDILISLQDKGIILKSYKIPNSGETLDPYSIEFNKNFKTNFYRASYYMGEELFENYPISCVISGNEYKLRRVSKKYDSLEQAYQHYGKYIRHSDSLHKEILDLIKWGKDNNYSFSTLGDFIVDRDWINIKAIKDNGQINNSAMTLL